MNRIQFQTIANEVGVNVRTIYRVMNNNGAVSNSTRKKVVNALNRYGYLCAGQRKSENIVFDICKNEFVERIGIQLMQSLSMQDFKCIPTNHMENRERFMAAVSDASVVVMCSFLGQRLIDEIKFANPDCVVINILGGSCGDVAIDSDDYLGGAIAARHLYANGHRHVLVASALDQPNHVDRCKSFRAEMMFLNPACQVDFLEFVPGRDDAPFFWHRYFSAERNLPTAIFCTMGGIAYHLPYYAAKYGIRIPEDISLVCYNRPRDSNFHSTSTWELFPLDSIVFEPEQIVTWANYFILHRPLDTAGNPVHTLIRPKLVVNNTVKNINSGEEL